MACVDVSEANYEDIAISLENVANNGKTETAFRYSRKGIRAEIWFFLDSACVWKFVISEGDFKASDVAMGRSFNLDSVSFIIDLIPHK